MSESTLVKMSNCWKSHAWAQLFFQMLVLASLLLLSSVVGIQGLPRTPSGDKEPTYLELAEKIAEEFMKRQGEGDNDVGMYLFPDTVKLV